MSVCGLVVFGARRIPPAEADNAVHCSAIAPRGCRLLLLLRGGGPETVPKPSATGAREPFSRGKGVGDVRFVFCLSFPFRFPVYFSERDSDLRGQPTFLSFLFLFSPFDFSVFLFSPSISR